MHFCVLMSIQSVAVHVAELFKKRGCFKKRGVIPEGGGGGLQEEGIPEGGCGDSRREGDSRCMGD